MALTGFPMTTHPTPGDTSTMFYAVQGDLIEGIVEIVGPFTSNEDATDYMEEYLVDHDYVIVEATAPDSPAHVVREQPASTDDHPWWLTVVDEYVVIGGGLDEPVWITGPFEDRDTAAANATGTGDHVWGIQPPDENWQDVVAQERHAEGVTEDEEALSAAVKAVASAARHDERLNALMTQE